MADNTDNVATTSSFNPAITDFLTSCYRDLDIITDTETLTAAQYNEGLFKCNCLVKTMEATGIHVWTEEEAILFLQPYQARYIIGAPSGPVAHTADAFAWTLGALASSYSAGATTLTLQAPVGLATNNIGIVLDSGVTFWTTISSVPTLNQVVLNSALPGSASAGNVVVSYAAGGEIARPLRVPKARLLTFAQNQATGQVGLENPMTILSRQEYMDLPDKQAPGVPTQWFYTPQRSTGFLFVWPVPTTSAWALRFTWYRPLADLLVPNNTLDFPQEWCTPLRWMLANELAPGYSLPPQRAQMIKANAADWLDIVSGWDRESEPISFGMDWQFS